jgi:formate dehydrogenase subunit delta
MDIANLVHMANRIGQFFESQPDRTEAKAGIVDHLCKFWAPRMRLGLLQQLDGEGTSELHPLVREAVTERREHLAPADLQGRSRCPV